MKSILVLVLVLSSAFAHAFEDYGIEAGFRSQNFDHDSTAANEKSEIGYQLGFTGNQPISAPWVLRSGLMYTERPLKFSTTAGDFKLKLTYFDIPLQFGYKFDFVTLYAGPTLAIKLSDNYECPGGACTKPTVEGVIVPVSLGASFRFAPQIGANVFFEMGTGRAAANYESLRAVGANFVVFID